MKKHTKLLASAAAAVLLLTFGATTAFASDGWQGRYYTDANGDGVCDHIGSACSQYLDANGDGICDRCGSYIWVDADGDGVCDYHSSQDCTGCHGGNHYAGGHHAGGHGGHCR